MRQELPDGAATNTGPDAGHARPTELPEPERVQTGQHQAAPRTPTAARAPADVAAPQPLARTPAALRPSDGVGLGENELMGDRAQEAVTSGLQVAVPEGQALEAHDVQARAHQAMLQGLGWEPEQYGPHPFSTAAMMARSHQPFAPAEPPPDLPDDIRRSAGWSVMSRAREAFQRKISNSTRGSLGSQDLDPLRHRL